MSVEIKVNLAAYPKGALLAFNGLGQIENGTSKTLTEEEEFAFVATNGASVKDVFKDQDGITVKGTPTVKPSSIPESNTGAQDGEE